MAKSNAKPKPEDGVKGEKPAKKKLPPKVKKPKAKKRPARAKKVQSQPAPALPEVVQNPPDADPETIMVAATMAANGMVASDATTERFAATDHDRVPHAPEGPTAGQVGNS